MSRPWSARAGILFVGYGLALNPNLAARADGPQSSHAAAGKKEAPGPVRFENEADARAAVDRMLAASDMAPHPTPSIPEDPPPHEGAMIDLPVTIGTADLLLVEVLEALPGRPISGERLVRPDGKISLGFYGEIYVKGLTPRQARVAVLKHLRSYISDQTLGLIVPDLGEDAEAGPPARPIARPEAQTPELEKGPFDFVPEDPARPADTKSDKPRASAGRPSFSGDRRASRQTGAGPLHVPPIGTPAQTEEEAKKAAPATRGPIRLQFGPGASGRVTISVEVGADRETIPIPPPAADDAADLDQVPYKLVPLAENDRVFVDITAYNSKHYYVLGEVAKPGMLPYTGGDTVLDALQYAGGLLPTADPGNTRLVRPGRGGKPARVYGVGLEAIQGRGDALANYQLFPGDRLIIGWSARDR